MGNPKYEIGNNVKMKFHKDTEFFITAILEETCQTGTQVSYVGRAWLNGQLTSKIRVSEVELEEK